ncbi:MAG: hypothetical protein E6J34_19300 [Chloroflexi bacterium]|nr:MAG: hypothetical protein E6J34_19300 [Chloroflexota bacterium]
MRGALRWDCAVRLCVIKGVTSYTIILPTYLSDPPSHSSTHDERATWYRSACVVCSALCVGVIVVSLAVEGVRYSGDYPVSIESVDHFHDPPM